MDECGIDFQVLSLDRALDPALRARNRRAPRARRERPARRSGEARIPTRFAAFAAIPTPDPKAAADELERTVTKYGFKGAMVHRLTNGVFLDEKRFWPIFERAAALDVPLYMHPANPSPIVADAYYKDYVQDFPMILRAGWGFTVETATQGIRLVLTGVFEKYPNLKIILGHLGEGLPFLLWRIEFGALARRQQSRSNSANCSASISGSRRAGSSRTRRSCAASRRWASTASSSRSIIPYVMNKPAVDWIPHIPLCEEDKEKILHGNVEKLLKL